MEFLIFIPYILFISFGIYITILVIQSKDERKKFKTIKFDKYKYLIVDYLYGDIEAKTSKGVFFEDNDSYTFKCEYEDGTVIQNNFKKSEIDSFEVKRNLKANIKNKYLDYDMDYTSTYFSGVPQGEFEIEKGIKYNTVFETKINFKSGKKIIFQSKKNPENFFNK